MRRDGSGRALSGGALAIVVVLMTGCGNAVVPLDGRAVPVPPTTSVPSPSVTSPSVATSATPEPRMTANPPPTTIMIGDRQVRSWPEGVTLPATTSVVSAATDGKGGTVGLGTVPPAALLGHLRGEFSRVGLTVELDSAVGFSFRGTGWSGTAVATEGVVVVTWSVGEWIPGRHAADLGITTGAPAFMRYPAGSRTANVRLDGAGSSYDLIGRPPADLLSYYRAELQPFFTITDDRTEDGVTTLRFTDREYDSVMTVTATTCRVVHTRRR